MKKIVLLSLALVLALGSLGVGYAMWSDTVTIDGTVGVAEMVIGFQEITPSEEPEYMDKDWVGSFDAWGEIVVGTHWSDYWQEDMDIYDKIVAVVDNGYPGYSTHLVFTVANGGTIPVHITSFTLIDPTGELDFLWITPPPATPAVGVFWKDFDGDTARNPDESEDIIRVQLVNLVSHQLEPCDEEKAELDFLILQPAEQNHQYKILATIVGQQWSE